MLLREPLPNGTDPIFHDIFLCLSARTPTELSEEVNILFNDPDVFFTDASVDI